MKSYDNFFLPSRDLEKSRNFYRQILGLPVKFDFTKRGMLAFNVGEEEPAIVLKARELFPDVKPAIWFVVDNVRQDYKRLLAQGVTFLAPPFAIATGLAVEFEDPDGNRLGITDYSRR